MKAAAILLIVSFAIIATVVCKPDAADVVAFTEWANKKGKKYDTPSEQNYRLTIFAKNLKKVKETNERQKDYELELNDFADLSEEEFLVKYTGLTMPEVSVTSTPTTSTTSSTPLVGSSSSVDWRTSGAVPSIKDQGQCGSCWAFAATSVIESAWKIKNNNAVQILSEQQMVDCSNNYGNSGCNGGWMTNAYNYIKTVGG